MFASRPVFTLGPLPLRLQVLSFLKQHCSDRVRGLLQNLLAITNGYIYF